MLQAFASLPTMMTWRRRGTLQFCKLNLHPHRKRPEKVNDIPKLQANKMTAGSGMQDFKKCLPAEQLKWHWRLALIDTWPSSRYIKESPRKLEPGTSTATREFIYLEWHQLQSDVRTSDWLPVWTRRMDISSSAASVWHLWFFIQPFNSFKVQHENN